MVSLLWKELKALGLDTCPQDPDSLFEGIGEAEVLAELARTPAPYSVWRAKCFFSPAAGRVLEKMAQRAHQLTLQRFGRTMQLYAPLYVSNYCCNRCLYCGFNSTHTIDRMRLSIDEAVAEAKIIAAEGFTDLLLVSGDDPAHISTDYLCRLCEKLRPLFSALSIEIFSLSKDDYARLFAAGVEGMTLYQETYDAKLYPSFHPSGPKADYERRMQSVEDAAAAGMRQIGVGALLGINHWRYEALCASLQGHVIMKNFWRTRISLSFPRMRPAAEVVPAWLRPVSDAELTQMIVACRLLFADAGLNLSTRESAAMREHLLPLGITRISAGSKTNPGGYGQEEAGEEQFAVADDRSPAVIADMLRAKGYDPVWKDWDGAFRAADGAAVAGL